MMRGCFFTAVLTLFITFAPRSATAADLIADISSHRIEITSSFTGTSLLLFGAIDWAKNVDKKYLDARDLDIIVVVRGPAIALHVRKKESIGGVWVNRQSAITKDMPGFYVVASTRPLHDILLPEEVTAYSLGLENIDVFWTSPPPKEERDDFRRAINRRLGEEYLFAERPNAVTVLSDTLFRTEIFFPVNVPVGQYRAEVFLARDGLIVARQTTPLSVDKIGFERAVYDFAHAYPSAYGIIAVILALAAGVIAGAISRRAS